MDNNAQEIFEIIYGKDAGLKILSNYLNGEEMRSARDVVNENYIELLKKIEKNKREIDILNKNIGIYKCEYLKYNENIEHSRKILSVDEKKIYKTLKSYLLEDLKDGGETRAFEINKIVVAGSYKLLIEYHTTGDLVDRIDNYIEHYKNVKLNEEETKPDNKINNDNLLKMDILIKENEELSKKIDAILNIII